jgi:hypothetical protein
VLLTTEKEDSEALLRFCMRWAVFWLTNRAPLEALQEAHDETKFERS